MESIEERTAVARQAYAGLTELRCVWTGRLIRRFEVDHLIPFSLWFNNDLWNLVPAARSINLAKKDKLVSRRTLIGSRELIIHYWRILRTENERRFELELSRSLVRGGGPQGGWENAAFAGLTEAIEMIAVQRGVERWSA